LYVDFCKQLLTTVGYFWLVAAIWSHASVIQISLHGSEVQESGEIEHRVSLLQSPKGKFA